MDVVTTSGRFLFAASEYLRASSHYPPSRIDPLACSSVSGNIIKWRLLFQRNGCGKASNARGHA
jgi:hypothetical protein